MVAPRRDVPARAVDHARGRRRPRRVGQSRRRAASGRAATCPRRGAGCARRPSRRAGTLRAPPSLPGRRVPVRARMSRRSLRPSAAIAGGRVAGWLSRVTGRGQGATISGRVINTMAPKALAELASGQRVALVSATNGKTTTTRFLAAAVARTGEPVVSNATGANLTSGIAPILARAQSPGLAVLEVDELVLPGRWNLTNAALAVTAAATHFGVDPREAAEAAATITTVAGRYMSVALPDGRRARVLLAKNPAGWSEVLHHLSVPPPARRNCPVVIGVNARVPDGKDPPW